MSRKQFVGIVNAVCSSRSGNQVQAVLVRERGDVPVLQDGTPNPDYNGKTIRMPPSLFREGIPMAGEAVYIDTDDRNFEEGPRYRTLRNAKVSQHLTEREQRAYNPVSATDNSQPAEGEDRENLIPLLCSCNTKGYHLHEHKEDCDFRVAAEAEAKRAAGTSEGQAESAGPAEAEQQQERDTTKCHLCHGELDEHGLCPKGCPPF